MDYTASQIVDRVVGIIRESLDLESTPIELSTSIIGELGAESLDFLDILFRIERAFSIKIERNRLERELRERFPSQTISKTSPIDAELASALKTMMPEVPPEHFEKVGKLKDLTRVFTVATFVRLAVEGLSVRGKSVQWDVDAPFTSQQLGVATGP